MSWFNAFGYAATAAVQIAFTALIVWLVASNWLFDRKLIVISTFLSTLLVAVSLPFHDNRLPLFQGMFLVAAVGLLIGAAWLKRHKLSMDTNRG